MNIIFRIAVLLSPGDREGVEDGGRGSREGDTGKGNNSESQTGDLEPEQTRGARSRSHRRTGAQVGADLAGEVFYFRH